VLFLTDFFEFRMSPQPLIVSIPHRLGKAEAIRRLKAGLTTAQAQFGSVFSIDEEAWTDGHLQFRISALRQPISGTIDVAEDHARLEVQLPWLLAQIAGKIQQTIEKQGTIMLEKK
jgi:hypothetical protein